MSRGRVVHTLAVGLSLIAALISHRLLLKHVTGSSGAKWFDAGCTESPTPGAANCAAVLASPYSYFPPKRSEARDGVPRLPVAFLGLVYYSAISVWFLGVGRPSPHRRRIHAVPLAVIGCGLAASVYYTMVMFRVLDQWCSWCMATHVLNVVIAVCAVLMWPGRVRTVVVAGEHAPGGVGMGLVPPATRVVVVTVLAIAAVAYGQLNMLGLKTWKRQALSATEGYNTCLTAVNRIKGDAEMLLKRWESATRYDIAIRPDDPVRIGPGGSAEQPTLDVVVFSDFECPSCGRFAAFFEEQAQPLFAGRVKTVFKHYPLDKACNERTTQTVHPHACEAVSMAEAARMVAGNDGFWRVHDYLYQHREALAQGKVAPATVAAETGLESKAFLAALPSEQTRTRLSEDIQQARACEVRGTPAVFVEGKQVDMLAITEIGFWDKLADVYWQRVDLPRPASTRPKSTSATPGSPGLKDAP